MKLIKSIKNEVKATARSARQIWRSLLKLGLTIQYVLSQPVNFIYGLLAAMVSVCVGVWLANVTIIQELFTSSSLALGDQMSFLFGLFATTLRNMAGLQVGLIIFFLVGSILLWAFWLEALRLQHDSLHYREKFAGLLLASVVIIAVGIIGIHLVTPVITRIGISTYVSDHFSGTLVLLLAVLMQMKTLDIFARRLHPVAERSRRI